MRILFVHQNFPGQFVHLAPALQARGHTVVALTRKDNDRKISIPNVKYPFKEPEMRGLGASYVKFANRGAAAAAAADKLRREHNFVPDLIVGHGGWGELLFLREVWPTAKVISYVEFFYRTTGLDVGFDPEFGSGDLGTRIRVASRQPQLLHTLAMADIGIAPTHWQASTFPDVLQDMINVIHDGVDTDYVKPDDQAEFTVPGGGPTLRPGDEVLTFVNRNLEPYRGYHTFMRALPDVLAARPEAQVVIVGREGQSYGQAPKEGTWKQIFLDEVKDRLDLARVHFTGPLPYPEYVKMLQVSRVHAYLTYPFVLSWSMLESMAAGVHLVGSATAPVEEVLEDGVNGQLVDFFDVAGWSKAITAGLASPTSFDHLREGARRTVLERYDLKTVCLPRMIEFVEAVGEGRLPAAQRG